MGQINGIFVYNGAGLNGAIAKLWKEIGFYQATDSTDTVQDNPMTGVQLTLLVNNNANFSDEDIIQVENEIMLVISAAANPLTVERAYHETAAVAHVLNTTIYILTTDPPAQDDAEPAAGYQQGAQVTTSVVYGGDGAFRFTGVPMTRYYVSVYYDGHRAWMYMGEPAVGSIMILEEDLLIRRSGILNNLSIGGEAQILTIAGGLIAWQTPVAAQVAEVEISTAEILNLFTVPKTLVAAPGANQVLEFVSLTLSYDWNTAAYVIGAATNLQVKYINAAGQAASTVRAVTGFIDQVADMVVIMDKVEQTIMGTVAQVVNVPLVLDLLVANPTVGDSPIHASVAYRVHNTGF